MSEPEEEIPPCDLESLLPLAPDHIRSQLSHLLILKKESQQTVPPVEGE